MNKGKGKNRMFIPTVIMAVLAVILVFIGYHRGEAQHIAGFRTAIKMTIEILPLLFFAFIVAGMVKTLISHELILKWIGAESGMRGILIGTVIGGFTPGGPYVGMPLAAGLLRSGASVGTIVAFLTAWSLWGVGRIPIEIGIIGWKFALVRLASTFFFPPIAGFIANTVFGRLSL